MAKFGVGERFMIKIGDDMFNTLLHCCHIGYCVLRRASPRIALALIPLLKVVIVVANGRVVLNF